MAQFIIGGNRRNGPEVVEAPSLSMARRASIIADFRDGYIEIEELRDCWAEPWTWERAYDLDLLPYQGVPMWVENVLEGWR